MGKNKIKLCFRGVFKFYRKVIILYAYSYTEKQAKLTMCRRIAKSDNVHIADVLSYFADDNHNYEITIET